MVWTGHSPEKVHWDDLQVPATGLRVAGAVSPPDVDNNYAGTLLFASNATEAVGLTVQLPHGYKEGSLLKPHVHWTKTTSELGGVYWEMDYKWARIGEVIEANWTTIGSSDVSNEPYAGEDTATADLHLITGLGDIDGTGSQISDMLLIVIKRIHDNAEDTYGADARLLEFDIHYQSDDPGSHQQFIKAPAE